jgi:hypothetical protein
MFFSIDMINPLWEQWKGSHTPTPIKKNGFSRKVCPLILVRSPSTIIG